MEYNEIQKPNITKRKKGNSLLLLSVTATSVSSSDNVMCVIVAPNLGKKSFCIDDSCQVTITASGPPESK